MLGLVLSGGGARGAFQAGVWARLAADPRFANVDVLAGTSAGAINAALIAAGKTPEQIRGFWVGLGDDPPITTNAGLFRSVVWNSARVALTSGRIPTPRGVRSVLSRTLGHIVPDPGNVLALFVELLLTHRFDLVDRLLSEVKETALTDTSRLRERLIDTFGSEEIRTDRLLAINTVDALSHQVLRLVNGPVQTTNPAKYVRVDRITVDMILASAAIPLLFPPVRLKEGNSRLFWDGGVLVNTPMAPAVALGADTIVPILSTEAINDDVGQFENLGDAFEHLGDTLIENSYNVDRKLLLERNPSRMGIDRYREVTLYRPVRPHGRVFSAGSYIYFQREQIEGMYAVGEVAASNWLSEGPLRDGLPQRSVTVPPPG